MVAVIGALMLLGLAMYHAWIRKTAVLAGVIVPAAIMILYAAWVVFLTKRDKKRFLSINVRPYNEQICYFYYYKIYKCCAYFIRNLKCSQQMPIYR